MLYKWKPKCLILFIISKSFTINAQKYCHKKIEYMKSKLKKFQNQIIKAGILKILLTS